MKEEIIWHDGWEEPPEPGTYLTKIKGHQVETNYYSRDGR